MCVMRLLFSALLFRAAFVLVRPGVPIPSTTLFYTDTVNSDSILTNFFASKPNSADNS